MLGYKVAVGLSNLVMGALLKAGGYIAGAVQSASALTAINAGFIYIPAVLAVVWLVIICFYDLDKQYPTIIRELEARRTAS